MPASTAISAPDFLPDCKYCSNVMSGTYTPCNIDVNRKLHGVAFPDYVGCNIICVVEKPKKYNYFAHWRKKRGLTQNQVLARLEAMDDDNMPKTAASLSRCENEKQNYPIGLIHALSEIYECEVWQLFGDNPLIESELHDLTNRLEGPQVRQAEIMLRALLESADGTGTGK